MNTLEQRLQDLEGDFRRSRRINRLLILAVVTVTCIAGAKGKTPEASKPTTPNQVPSADAGRPDDKPLPGQRRLRTVEADQFVLLDQHGRTRLRVAMTDGGPAICMYDEKGHKRLELGQSRITTGLSLLDADESPVVSLQLPQKGNPAQLEIRSPQSSSLTKASGFSVNDAAERARLQLALINGNFPILGISQSGQNGPPSIELTANDGSRSLKIHDENGYPLFSVFAADSGKTSVNMRHPDHERSIQISNGPENVNGPTIAFFASANKDGTGGKLPLLQFGLHKDRQPYVRIVDGEGRTRFAAPSK